MLAFFKSKKSEIYAVLTTNKLKADEIKKLSWVFSDSDYLDTKKIQEKYVGPTKTMITPWSTNAVEIVENMGVNGVKRIELFVPYANCKDFDKTDLLLKLLSCAKAPIN